MSEKACELIMELDDKCRSALIRKENVENMASEKIEC